MALSDALPKPAATQLRLDPAIVVGSVSLVSGLVEGFALPAPDDCVVDLPYLYTFEENDPALAAGVIHGAFTPDDRADKIWI